MVRREKSNYTIQSVSHALDVLEQFSGESDELGVTELSKRLKLHKNNVFRLLATLEARGYIEQNKTTENYRLGVRCLRLGQRFVSQLGLLRQARVVMQSLAQTSHETAILAVFRNGSIIPLDAVEAEQTIRLVCRIGDNQPLHCTAVGKLYLALGDDSIRDALPETLERFTERTIVDRSTLEAEVRKIADLGYAVEIGEHVEDVRSVAVPVQDYTRTIVASLALAGPGYRLPQERIDGEITPLLVQAGRDLSSRLGFDANA